jgi:hypothetical protein
MSAWPVENIPDRDALFARVLQIHISHQKLQPGFFRPHNGGMSVDWSEYSTASETRARGAARRKLTDYGVVSLVVGAVRRIDGLLVKHDPLDDNRAHTNIWGLSATSAIERALVTARRERLVAIAELKILPTQNASDDPHV